MYNKTVEVTKRAWKFDNKYIWATIFIVGNLLGYAIPESIEGYIPFANKSDVQLLDSRIDDLETEVFGSPNPLDKFGKQEPPVEVTPEPQPQPPTSIPKIKIERN